MDDTEVFKHELISKAKTKEVRLGQTKDHLVWRHWFTDNEGEQYPSNFFVFEQEDGTVICVEMASGPFTDTYGIYNDRDAFLSWVKNEFAQ